LQIQGIVKLTKKSGSNEDTMSSKVFSINFVKKNLNDHQIELAFCLQALEVLDFFLLRIHVVTKTRSLQKNVFFKFVFKCKA